MYDDIVKRLRSAESNYQETLDCLWEAADAIEGLNKKYLAVEIDNTNLTGLLIEERAKHRWVSVTERLPEEPYGCLAIVWDNNVMTGDTFLNYYPEYIGFDGESWNDCDGEEIPLEVVYWMKMPQIPEPPKEET